MDTEKHLKDIANWDDQTRAIKLLEILYMKDKEIRELKEFHTCDKMTELNFGKLITDVRDCGRIPYLTKHYSRGYDEAKIDIVKIIFKHKANLLALGRS